jgi:hypothetical protein
MNLERSKKLLRRAFLGSAIVLALALAGCGEADEGSAEPGIGTFSIDHSQSFAGSTKGTVYPDLTEKISRYMVAYTDGDDIDDSQEFAGDADAITLSLPVGTYTFTVTAYANDVVLATGTLADVALSAGPNQPAAVTMHPETDGVATGTFKWNITVPIGADVINLIIDKEDPEDITANLDSTGDVGLPLSVGFHTYQVVGLADDEPVCYYAGQVYIYPADTGLVSTLVLVASDFSAGGYVNEPPNGGASADITVTLTFDYAVPHVVTLSDPTTLSVDSYFTNCTWFINGKDTGKTDTSFSLSNIKAEKYIVWFTGNRAGVTHSDLVSITVAEAP